MRTILHVDMDAFYASVEQRDDPSLRGKPVIVGGRSRRGVVLAASYEVRPFGVRSAMPMAEALRRAPHAIVVPPHRDRYEAASEAAFGDLPAVHAAGRAALARRGVPRRDRQPVALRRRRGDRARRIKRDIRTQLGLTASAGVAACKFVAKVASDLRKPDGLVVVPEGEAAAFLAPLPVERMWGVGPKTAPKMRELGFLTLGDLARADEATLERALGSWGAEVARLARGEDDRDVVPDGLAQVDSGRRRRTRRTSSDATRSRRLSCDHAGRVARRLVRAGLVGAHGRP